MKKQIPNIITLLNLFSGCIAMVMAFTGNFSAVVLWVILAAIFDFFDGCVARSLEVSSKIGVELDSLADIVSFGIAPASAVFILLRDFTLFPTFLSQLEPIIPYVAFLIPVFSAYRLAKFNIDDRQTISFLGLPTPANGLFWVSYAYGMHLTAASNGFYLYLTVVFILVLSILMISEVPMFSLKIKILKIRGNEKQLLLIVVMTAFVLFWGITGVAWGILAYIVVSIATMRKNKGIR
ncbi:MAG: CDP-alcohol phosphatidyltransferase family protein [Petrimonas sp.]|jgi:CDP-diacylglycerol--serine O-phosphatidyltransferase|uniref:CDP-alcohol phosphatidyltransferase family protein n=1 Tax=Petrimonas sp. TaxID=2023866 RepID=UPI002B3CB980|nr:CDP-alcohol phosphatidyltransferase family protein [Petrimonas sp.]MEA5043520.1 CDP-alcohol phosphatidyltransferase family protein [Petrimonas sp.]MEA5070740.1 CDP-alcohol phosphatidyltransferase family protein [Petrimonas sp.]